MEKKPLSLCSLSTGYGKRDEQQCVSHHLDASLPYGALTALVGVNGAGKSTLLRTLAGLQPSLDGQILLHGCELSTYSTAEIAKQIAIVLTERIEVDFLKAREVVEMGRMPYTSFTGRLRSNDHNAVRQAMLQTNTLQFAEKSIKALSDGERQRVMIAKALAQDAPIILLDEPTAFLDFPSKVEVLRLLSSLAHDKGKSILLSIHDIELALQFSDQLWLLSHDGICQGEPQELAKQGILSALFSAHGISLDPTTLKFSLDL